MIEKKQQPRVQWGDNGFASVSGFAYVHCANKQGEYFLSQDVWVVVGTGLPADAYLDAPPQPVTGYAIVRAVDSWTLVDDYRGSVAYDKVTRQPSVIDQLGPIPDALTSISPQSNFDVWDDQLVMWVKDTAAEHAWHLAQATHHRQLLMSEASQEIAVLVDALDPSIINDPSDDDHVKLIAWKAYRVELSKIDQQSGYPTDINWPEKPR